MKKQTKKVIIGCAILLVLGAGSGITYYVVNKGSDNNATKQETNAEYVTVTDADIENEITENADSDEGEDVSSVSGGLESLEEVKEGKGETEEVKMESTTTEKKDSTEGNNTSEEKPAQERTTEERTTEDRTTEERATEERTTEERTTESQNTKCNHNWVAKYKIIHHPAETHTEEQKICVREAYTETIYDWHNICAGCGLDMDNAGFSIDDIASHCYNCQGGSSYIVEEVAIGTEEVPAEYETRTVTVVDKEAWDEKVVDYYSCSECGATK